MRLENSQIYTLKDSKIKQELDYKMVETVVQIKWNDVNKLTFNQFSKQSHFSTFQFNKHCHQALYNHRISLSIQLK